MSSIHKEEFTVTDFNLNSTNQLIELRQESLKNLDKDRNIPGNNKALKSASTAEQIQSMLQKQLALNHKRGQATRNNLLFESSNCSAERIAKSIKVKMNKCDAIKESDFWGQHYSPMKSQRNTNTAQALSSPKH